MYARTGERRALTAEADVLMDRPYRIGPGDTIDVTFRFTPEFNDEAIVDPDGRVALSPPEVSGQLD